MVAYSTMYPPSSLYELRRAHYFEYFNQEDSCSQCFFLDIYFSGSSNDSIRFIVMGGFRSKTICQRFLVNPYPSSLIYKYNTNMQVYNIYIYIMLCYIRRGLRYMVLYAITYVILYCIDFHQFFFYTILMDFYITLFSG